MKLIKTEDEQGVMYSLSGDNIPDNYVLSKQNCDSLFGVVDVEKLAKEESYKAFSQTVWINGFKAGFNKAMELNRFTLEDIRKAYYVGYEDGKSGATFFQQLIQSLQQPTEIEVVIVMEEILQLKKRAGGFTNMGKPKLDSDGQLILKKI